MNPFFLDRLLVGIFWTRVGSPTGLADSGTLEEVERVASAGKPIMLYFSRREIDPDRIDTAQIDRLKKFREKVQLISLNETYRNIIDFRDKFARQLEMKVRDLQRNETAGEIPLSLKVLSNDTGDPEDAAVERWLQFPILSKLEDVLPEQQDEVNDLVNARINELSFVSVALGVWNESTSSVRNIYVELSVISDNNELQVTNSAPRTWGTGLTLFASGSYMFEGHSELGDKVRQTFSKYDDNLQKDAESGGWKLSFEWDAVQPQRLRLIRPILFLSAPSSTEVRIISKIYSDFSPEPFELTAQVSLKIETVPTDLTTLIPNWRQLLQKDSSGVAWVTASENDVAAG